MTATLSRKSPTRAGDPTPEQIAARLVAEEAAEQFESARGLDRLTARDHYLKPHRRRLCLGSERLLIDAIRATGGTLIKHRGLFYRVDSVGDLIRTAGARHGGYQYPR